LTERTSVWVKTRSGQRGGRRAHRAIRTRRVVGHDSAARADGPARRTRRRRRSRLNRTTRRAKRLRWCRWRIRRCHPRAPLDGALGSRHARRDVRALERRAEGAETERIAPAPRMREISVFVPTSRRIDTPPREDAPSRVAPRRGRYRRSADAWHDVHHRARCMSRPIDDAAMSIGSMLAATKVQSRGRDRDAEQEVMHGGVRADRHIGDVGGTTRADSHSAVRSLNRLTSRRRGGVRRRRIVQHGKSADDIGAEGPEGFRSHGQRAVSALEIDEVTATFVVRGRSQGRVEHSPAAALPRGHGRG